MGVIEINGVSKSYGQLKALSDISLEVGQGEIFGLIGPDGAGKTTLFRIMTTLMLPDAGSGSICGLDIVRDYSRIRRIIGYMPGRFSLYQDLTVKENLDYFATLFGTTVSSSYGTIREIYSQIEPFRDRRAGKLSGGMKQKLALCCALVHKPAVLFLDEPTTGVDAVSRKDFWTMLSRIRESGVSVFVSTPYMDEASMCDRLAMIRPMLKILRAAEGVISCFSFGNSHHLAYDPARTGKEALLKTMRAAGFDDCSVREIAPGIEDCFMQLAGK